MIVIKYNLQNKLENIENPINIPNPNPELLISFHIFMAWIQDPHHHFRSYYSAHYWNPWFSSHTFEHIVVACDKYGVSLWLQWMPLRPEINHAQLVVWCGLRSESGIHYKKS